MNKSGRIKDLGVKRGKEESKPFERLGGVEKDKKKEAMEEKTTYLRTGTALDYALG